MDCQAFDSTLLDALYDELDERTSAAMDEHAAGCESCASRSSGLKRTQELFRPFLETPFPEGLEARILAASEAAMDARVTSAGASAAGAKVVSLADRRAGAAVVATAQPQPQQKAKTGVVAFLSRPQFAIAATFLLVLGAAALFINSDKSKRSDSAAASSPVMVPPTGAVASREDDGDLQQNNINAPPPPAVEAVATATVAAPSASGPATVVALAERGDPSSFDRPSNATPSPAQPPSLPRAGAGRGADLSGLSQSGPSGGSGAGTLANKGSASGGESASLAEARTLYNARRYNEALPKFQALAASNAEAELYVARCLANTKGCDAAAPHYDNAAKRNANTQTGSTIALEAARCYSSHGQTVAARSRYEKLQTDNYVSSEANAELAAIDAKAGGVKATKPLATPAATPQAAPPAKAVDQSAR